MALSCVPGPPALADGDYLLGPQDRVRIKVHEWRPSLGTFFDWPALNDEFVVSAAGTLSLPFVGELPVSGVSPGQLGPVIAGHLMRRLQLGRQPDAAVEVVTYRPVYVAGVVTQPGEYAYRPELNVIQAVSLAGGLRRADSDTLQAELERDAISAAGELEVLSFGSDDLLARQARLRAELSDAERIEFPADLAGRADDPHAALVMARERHIFQTRREAFENQLRALLELKAHLEQEQDSLDAQLETEETRLALLRDELAGVASLAERGLVPVPRRLELQRSEAQAQGETLRAGSSLMRSRQERTRTEIAILELQNQRVSDAATELRDVEKALRETESRSDTARQQLLRTRVAALNLTSRARPGDLLPAYAILRQEGDETVEIPAAETTRLRPGDVVKVELAIGSRAAPLLSMQPGQGPKRPPHEMLPARHAEAR